MGVHESNRQPPPTPSAPHAGEEKPKKWPLRFYSAFLALFLTCNAIGFIASETLARLGPLPTGDTITFSTLVTGRDGKLLRPFITKDGYWRLPVTADDVDARFLKLLIAYEDKRFHSHHGVDPWAMLRAGWQALRNGRAVSGGSTLTMQVARLLEPRPGRRFRDKLAEMIRAVQLERRFSKRQILDLYLRLAPYGGNIEGIRAASLAYFGKEPKRLSTAESALLVALPQAPEARRPDRKPQAAAAARNRVIVRLRNDGIVNPDQAEAAAVEEAPKGRLAFPMLAAHVAERLAKTIPDGTVEETTIDGNLQASLEALARDRALAIGSGVAAAILVADNTTGEVMAHVGGTGYFDQLRAGQMDLTQSLRSPGSTLKPFIYGLAFEDGVVHPETLIDDRAIRYGAYAPENFDDAFHGTVTVRTALQQSLNVPALQILKSIGAGRLSARIGNAGVKLVLPKDAAGPGLAVGLGGAGIRLNELATLYVSLARGGDSLPLVWRVEDRAKAPKLRRLLEPNAAWMVSDVLKGAPTPDNALGGQIAFKTGTSYGYRDAWSVGYDGATTIAVWVGRPDGAAVSGITGRTAAAPILFEAFQRLGHTRKALPSAPPGTVIARTNELPAALQRFRPDALPQTASVTGSEAPLSIAFPPDGARIDVGDAEPGAVGLKAYGGTPPFTWLVDGLPVLSGEFRRDTFWEEPARGFARLSVIDAKGQTATARIRLD